MQIVMEHYDINFKNEAAKLEPKKRGRKPKAKATEEPKEESN
jgi:hypothetical protein